MTRSPLPPPCLRLSFGMLFLGALLVLVAPLSSPPDTPAGIAQHASAPGAQALGVAPARYPETAQMLLTPVPEQGSLQAAGDDRTPTALVLLAAGLILALLRHALLLLPQRRR